MSENKTIVEPVDNKKLPCESIGKILYNEITKKDQNKIILIDGETGDQITYGKLFELSVILANQLKKLRVKKGDVITIVAQNSWKYLLTMISVLYIGAQVNLLNPDYTTGELKYFLSICQPTLIFCNQKSLDNILKLKDKTCCPQNILLFDGDGGDQMKTFDGLIRDGEFKSEFTSVELNPEEDGALILTFSGTCGLPKCVPLPKNVQKIGSVGKVTHTHQIKICDVNNGRWLPPNQTGELRVKGGGVIKSYLGNTEEGETVFDEDGFLKTGDLGYYDDDDFFYIVGRLKEMIKYKGFQVASAELENLLIQHLSIKDAGVIGISDERAGEVPVAFVVKQTNKDVSEKEIIHYISENVSIQKRLYGLVRFLDEIPKSSSGKILRRKLKELL